MSYLNGGVAMAANKKNKAITGSGLNFYVKPLALFVALASFSVEAEVYFNPRFLSDDPSAVADLSSFEKGQEVPPGTYRVDIYMNDGFMATRDVTFKSNEKGSGLIPCLTRSQLTSMGVSTAALPTITEAESCIAVTNVINGATSRFDVGLQRLYLTVPQILMRNNARGYIPPELWDNGITAGLLNYTFSGNNVQNSTGGSSNYAYLSLQSGMNMGAWRLRDNSSWSYSSVGGGAASENRWQHINTYLERDIVPLRSRLTLGDSFTNSDIFDSLNFRGVQLASDDNMLPDSMKGFAPVIHGIARGTAQVSIRQNGYEIYQTTVPPGPFTINDLYAAGNSGDLQVTIKEADGSAQVLTVPYASVPVLQREGHTRFSLTAGEYRSGTSQQTEPGFFQGTLMRGLPAGWTLYGGSQLADRYRSFNLGVGKNLGLLGALSMDITQANATLPDESQHQGQSLRFLYNKSLSDIGTNIQLVGYRYSTRGYYNLADTTYNRMSGYNVVTQDGVIQIEPKFTDYYNLTYSKRGKLQVSVTQQINKSATLYLSGSHQTYWGTTQADQQLQAGLSSAIDDISWTLSYSLTKNAWQTGRDQMLAFSMNIPFSHWLRSDSTSAWRNANASYNASDDLDGRMTNTAGLYGTLLPDNNLSYSVQTGYTSGGGNGAAREAGTGYAALNYRGGYGNANVGYSRSEVYKQLYYGVSGGILAHENGVTFSQPMNDTVVLIKSPGAGNVRVENQTGVTTDWRGYAVLPYAMDYRENRVALDTNSLADNVDIDDAVVSVVPTHNAVVRADFRVRVGLKVLMTLSYNGKSVPFGSVVTPVGGEGGSIVADGGQVYLTGLPVSGKVLAKWGDQPGQQCVATYKLPPDSEKKTLSEISARCQ